MVNIKIHHTRAAMTVNVKRRDGGSFDCIVGHTRLRAQLEALGKATVVDVETGESFEVHQVDGQIVVMEDGRNARAETLASQAISRAQAQ